MNALCFRKYADCLLLATVPLCACMQASGHDRTTLSKR
jgi:hypothetical protein